MGEKFGLACSRSRENAARAPRRSGVQALPLRSHERRISRVLHECMLEAVDRLGGVPRRNTRPGFDEVVQRILQVALRQRRSGDQQLVRNSRPIAAATWATSRAGASRSSRASSDSCERGRDRHGAAAGRRAPRDHLPARRDWPRARPASAPRRTAARRPSSRRSARAPARAGALPPLSRSTMAAP